MPTTPNMNLLLPIPTVTPGPTYASENNGAFTTVDSHDHTLGKGVPIPSNAININNDLPFNGFNATSLRSTIYTAQGAPLSLPTDINSIYSVNGNLYWNNQIGQQVQITSGAALNASSIGGIGGDYVGSGALEFYTSASKTFTFWSSTNVPANLDAGSVTIRPILTSPHGVTINPPASLPASYALQLPPANLTGTTVLLEYDTSNNIILASPGSVNASFLTPQTITQNLLAPRAIASTVGLGGVAVASSAGNYNFSTVFPSFISVPALNVTITTSGRPVQLFMQPITNAQGDFSISSTTYVRIANLTNSNNVTVFTNITGAPDFASWLDMTVNGSPGTYNYEIEVAVSSGTSTITNCQLVAYEI